MTRACHGALAALPQDGQRYGFPREIFASAKATEPTEPTGYLGVVWGK